MRNGGRIKRSLQRALLAGLLSLALLRAGRPCFAGEPFENQWGPFTGTVVNADTNEPVPGAVFVVMWHRDSWTLIGGAPQVFFDARVAVADEEGRFEIPRRDPPLFSWIVRTPNLECVAPGYAWYHDVGAQNAPIPVRIRPLSAEERRRSLSHDPLIGMIPDDRCHALEDRINLRRRELHLRPIGFCSGNIDEPRQ